MSSIAGIRLSKRRFLGMALLGAAGSALGACAAPAPPTPTTAPKPAAPVAPAPSTVPGPVGPGSPTPAAQAAPTTAPAAAAATKPPAPAAAPAATAAPAGATKPSAATGARGGTLNYAESGDFADFNPWSFTAVNFSAYNQLFSRLFWKDGTGKLNPDLALTGEMASDNLSYKVTLRPNVKWHDGKPLVAQDFVDMYGYTKDEALSKFIGVSKVKGIMTPVKDVKATDPQTLVFSFEKPTPYITDILDYFYAIRIVDKSDPGFAKAPPIGTGPFKLNKWTPNQLAQLDRYADYHIQGQPLVDQVTIRRFSQAETIVPNLKSGAVDSVLLTSLSDVGPLQADPTYMVEPNENAGSIYDLILNVRKAPLDKREVRQALSYSLNRVAMAKSAFFGVGRPISSPFYSPSSMAYREDLVGAHVFDLQKARSLLDAAGVKELSLTTISQPALPAYKLFLLVWQADLAKIGVKLTVDEVENAKFGAMASDPNLQGLDMVPHLTGRTTRDPAIFLSTQAPWRAGEVNAYGYRNADYEKLVADGAVEPDPNKRKEIYQKLNQMLVDEMFMIPVATNPRIWASSKVVKGMVVDLTGNPHFAPVAVTR